MNWTFYLRNGIVYVPTMVRTEAGFKMIVEPIDVVPVGDTQAFEQALRRTLQRGNARVPTPTREELSRKPAVLRYAKVKTWSAFANSTMPWSIEELNGIYTIAPLKDAPGKPYKGHPGWVIDPERAETLPPHATIEEVAKQTVERVQASKTN